MLLSLTRLKMAGVDVDGFNSMSAIALTAVVGAVILLLVFLCNFVKKGFEKSKADSHGTPLTFAHGCGVTGCSPEAHLTRMVFRVRVLGLWLG